MVKETERWHKNEEDETLSKIGKQDCIGHANAYISARSEFENLFNYDSWLEKQGKKDSQVILPMFTFDDILALQCCMKKVQKDKELYNQLQTLHDRLHDTYWLEKQDEQKETLCDKCRREQPSHSCQDITELGRCALEHQSKQKPDKVEPKFKVGDKVNRNDREDEEYNILTITSVIIDEHCYTCNQDSVIDFEEQDLWHIVVEQKPDELPNGEKILVESESTCHHNDGLYYAIDILETTLGKVKGYQSDDGILEHKAAIEAVKKMKEQRPTIKPIFEVGDVMRTIDEAAKNVTSGLPVVVSIDKKYYKCNNELIAIKNQYEYEYPPINKQQKPIEWSEEDEKMLNTVILHVKEYQKIVNPANETGESNITDWLKSLKPRPHWKPSEEQLVALWKIIPNIVNSEEDVDTITELSILYENLKKL